VEQETELRQGEPEAYEGNQRRSGRDPGEYPGPQFFRLLPGLGNPDLVVGDQAAHRLEDLFDPGQLRGGSI